MTKTWFVAGALLLGVTAATTTQPATAQEPPATSNAEEIDRLISDQMDERGDVKDGTTITVVAEPESWQTNPDNLIKAAGSVVSTDTPFGTEYVGLFDDGTVVTLIVESSSSDAPLAASGCTRSVTGYNPTLQYGYARALGGYYISTGCDGGSNSRIEARAEICGFWGCNYDQRGKADFFVADNGQTLYKSVYGCENGNRKWRSEAQFLYGSLSRSPSVVFSTSC